MREGEVVLGWLAQRGAGRVDAIKLPSAFAGVGDRRGVAAKLIRAEQQELVMDIGHGSGHCIQVRAAEQPSRVAARKGAESATLYDPD